MIFSLILLGCSVCLAIRYLLVIADSGARRRYRQEEYERYESIIARDPSQAGSIAELAEMYYVDGDTGKAVELWRQAVRTMPHGPFSETWKRKLKRARVEYEAEQQGIKARDYVNQRACNECLAIIRKEDKICPKCGGSNFMLPSDLLNQRPAKRVWASETLIISLLFWIIGLMATKMPLIVKGGLIFSSIVAIMLLMLHPSLRVFSPRGLAKQKV